VFEKAPGPLVLCWLCQMPTLNAVYLYCNRTLVVMHFQCQIDHHIVLANAQPCASNLSSCFCHLSVCVSVWQPAFKLLVSYFATLYSSISNQISRNSFNSCIFTSLMQASASYPKASSYSILDDGLHQRANNWSLAVTQGRQLSNHKLPSKGTENNTVGPVTIQAP
jgi:hypothetical protein